MLASVSVLSDKCIQIRLKELNIGESQTEEQLWKRQEEEKVEQGGLD